MIDQHLRGHAGFPISFSADDIFYQTKGRLYAYYLLLKGLGQDFEKVLTSAISSSYGRRCWKVRERRPYSSPGWC